MAIALIHIITIARRDHKLQWKDTYTQTSARTHFVPPQMTAIIYWIITYRVSTNNKKSNFIALDIEEVKFYRLRWNFWWRSFKNDFDWTFLILTMNFWVAKRKQTNKWNDYFYQFLTDTHRSQFDRWTNIYLSSFSIAQLSHCVLTTWIMIQWRHCESRQHCKRSHMNRSNLPNLWRVSVKIMNEFHSSVIALSHVPFAQWIFQR